MSKEIMLSVFVITYNHEKYIRQALDSVINQISKFCYEIIIGDDASTDNTPNILKEYQVKYPDKIKLFLREKNLGGKGAFNLLDLVGRCSGKYVIALEGDDFWIDENKIEKQVCFLEKNPEYIGVSHKCLVVNNKSKPNGETYPECKDRVYSFRHLVSNILPGQFTTLMYKNIYRSNSYDYSILEEGLLPADRLIVVILLSYGRIYCMDEILSAYRHITNEGTSFSANVKWNYLDAKKWNEVVVQYSKKIKNDETKKYADLMLMKTIIGSRKRCSNKWNLIIRDLINEQLPLKRYLQYLIQLVNIMVSPPN